MTQIEIQTLIEFAQITLNYLENDNEYEASLLWEHLQKAVNLKKRLNELYPEIERLLNLKNQ